MFWNAKKMEGVGRIGEMGCTSGHRGFYEDAMMGPRTVRIANEGLRVAISTASRTHLRAYF